MALATGTVGTATAYRWRCDATEEHSVPTCRTSWSAAAPLSSLPARMEHAYQTIRGTIRPRSLVHFYIATSYIELDKNS